MRAVATALVAAFVMSAAACSPEGSAEKTGENMDSAIEEATQGEKNMGDGALERAGESIDNATGKQEANKDPADAVSDATDGDARTKP
jgi:hypothetical protein